MATEKILNTRIQLKYDSFAEWSSKNPTLKAGEVAIAYLTTAGAVKPGTGDTQHPVMFKVGPGAFNDLPWASALAADVHAWAKKSEADFTTWVKSLVDVSDIDTYNKGEIDAKFTANSTADQKYAKDYADSLAPNYDAAGKAQELIEALDVTDTAVTGQYVSAVSEVDGKVVVSRTDLPTYTLATGSANGTVAFNGADVAVKGLGSAAYTAANAYDAAGSAATAKSEAIAEAEAKVNALKNGEVKANADAIAAINNGTNGILAQAQAYADQAEADAIAAAAQDATTKVNALRDGAVADNTTAITNIKNGTSVNDFAAAETAIADAKKAGTDANAALEAYKISNDAAVALKASQAELEAEIARAKAAEKANSDAIALLVDSTEGDSTKLNSIKELATWIEEHGGDAAEMAEAIEANANAIASEAGRADAEEKRLAGLIADNAEAIEANAAAIEALGITDGKVANAAMADKANSLTDAAKAEVKAVKVDNATNADVANSLTDNAKAEVKAVKVDNAAHADSADNAAQLGGVAADQYATKAYADQAEADAISAANANTANVIKNYYTKSEADAAFMDSTETGNAIDAKITALNLATTYEPIGAETRAKAYADSLAGNYATAAQGAKADSALQSVEAGTGLKVSTKANNKQTIEIDDSVVFVFNCGTASTLVD